MKKCEKKETCSLPQTQCCETGNNSCLTILILFILLAIIIGGTLNF